MTSISMRVGVALALVCGLAAPLRAGDAFDKGVARRITPEEVQKRIAAGEKPIVLDTRGSVSDVVAKGAVRAPNDKIETWAKDASKDALIVAYCTWHAEATSARAVLQLQQLGFTNAYALLGGLDAWRAAKLPTEPAQ